MSEEIWFFSHLIVPLTDIEGRMRLNNKNKTNFILYCVRLSLPLSPKLENHDDDKKVSGRYSDVLAHQA